MILERHKTIVPLNSFGASLNVFSSMLKKSIFVATILAASINFAHAEDVVPDKFKIALGGYSVFRYDSTISLTDPDR
jgi:hypothetical protein